MTATALALDPVLDIFDDVDSIAPARPQLRLIEGDGFGQLIAPAPEQLALVEVQRRRRFLALLAVTALVLAIAWAAGVSVTSFGAAAAPVPTDAVPSVYVVHPGDSYGAIASEIGAANPIAGAEVLRAANGGGELMVGERLVVSAALSAEVAQAGA